MKTLRLVIGVLLLGASMHVFATSARRKAAQAEATKITVQDPAVQTQPVVESVVSAPVVEQAVTVQVPETSMKSTIISEQPLAEPAHVTQEKITPAQPLSAKELAAERRKARAAARAARLAPKS